MAKEYICSLKLTSNNVLPWVHVVCKLMLDRVYVCSTSEVWQQRELHRWCVSRELLLRPLAYYETHSCYNEYLKYEVLILLS